MAAEQSFRSSAGNAPAAVKPYAPTVQAPTLAHPAGGFGTPAPVDSRGLEIVDTEAPTLPGYSAGRGSASREYFGVFQDEDADRDMRGDDDDDDDDDDDGDEDKFKDCPHKFNDRNCCEDGSECDKIRRLRAEDSIRKISLNITPLFKPDAAGDIDLQKEQAKGLKKVTSRSWTNRQGAIVANGRFENYIDGRVVVMTDDGHRQRIPFYSLSDTDMCYVDAWWGLPTECTVGDVAYCGRNFCPTTFTWKASALCHKPLYFEERALERYGHSNGRIRQPLVSAAHFFLNLATVPYQMGLHPPFECQYALGYYRPGSCAPWMVPAIPLHSRLFLY